MRLEDLPGIKPHLITRLKRGGVETVFDLAASSPIELVEKGGGVLTREEEMTALELVTIAKKHWLHQVLCSKISLRPIRF